MKSARHLPNAQDSPAYGVYISQHMVPISISLIESCC